MKGTLTDSERIEAENTFKFYSSSTSLLFLISVWVQLAGDRVLYWAHIQHGRWVWRIGSLGEDHKKATNEEA